MPPITRTTYEAAEALIALSQSKPFSETLNDSNSTAIGKSNLKTSNVRQGIVTRSQSRTNTKHRRFRKVRFDFDFDIDVDI
jgi:hypothetical protein